LPLYACAITTTAEPGPPARDEQFRVALLF
jgi:hypothetical protein